MHDNRVAQLALYFTPGVGNFAIKQLISYAGSPQDVFKLPKGRLLKIPGIGNITANAILQKSGYAKADEELKKIDNSGAKLLLYTDNEFPERLRQINDSPALLYFKGSASLNHSKIVSIVGTRKCTEYGKAVTKKIIESLAKYNPLVISGLAYGIDIQAHKISLQNNIPTIGVMASGVDIIYPSVHKDVANKMIENGGLLTEQAIGAKPDAHNFPARNRIIAGMADVIIVIEAAKKGGALITAEIGNSYNKDVFAVPGHIDAPYSEGCNHLIKSHKAHLLNSVEDIEYIMNWDTEQSNPPKSNTIDISQLSDKEITIYELLKSATEPMMVDNISWHTQIPINELASILLHMEFSGLVSALPGKRYKLTI